MTHPDPLLAPLFEKYQPVLPQPKSDLHHYLCSSILSQQLSTKVARVIHQRFLDLYQGQPPQPKQILATDHDTLRNIGLSHAKVGYMKAVASFALDKGMSDEKLYGMGDEEIIDYLTQIKGVGRWTVEMMLLFGMGRPDVFAPDDLGIQKAMIRIFGLNEPNKKILQKNMLELSEAWRPERSLVSLALWASLS